VIVGRLIPAGTGLAYHRVRRRQATAPEVAESPAAVEETAAGAESQEQVA
jgi:DNA-directed RNA polymerase subunit beta'